MRNIILTIVVFTFIGCSAKKEINSSGYFTLIKKAELLVCEKNFKQASKLYTKAFKEIKKPFGKDLFNAALASQLSNNLKERDDRLQSIIDNSNELDYVKSKFVGIYLMENHWQELISRQKIKYNPTLRNEFNEIHERAKSSGQCMKHMTTQLMPIEKSIWKGF